MQPHCSAMPWVPGIADFTAIPKMGVVLLSCITASAITKVSVTASFMNVHIPSPVGRWNAENGLGGMLKFYYSRAA
jgi:hypothetical protein